LVLKILGVLKSHQIKYRARIMTNGTHISYSMLSPRSFGRGQMCACQAMPGITRTLRTPRPWIVLFEAGLLARGSRHHTQSSQSTHASVTELSRRYPLTVAGAAMASPDYAGSPYSHLSFHVLRPEEPRTLHIVVIARDSSINHKPENCFPHNRMHSFDGERVTERLSACIAGLSPMLHRPSLTTEISCKKRATR
jgi:hypothetical protein